MARKSSILRSWIARLGFSFIIIAFALGWTAREKPNPDPWFAGAVACLGIGIWGVRERHRIMRQAYDSSPSSNDEVQPHA